MERLEKLYQEYMNDHSYAFFESEKELAVYGGGTLGKTIIHLLKQYGITISVIIDRHAKGIDEDIPCIQSDVFFDCKENITEYKFLIATNSYAWVMLQRLLNEGVDENDIFLPRYQPLINGIDISRFEVQHLYFQGLDMKKYRRNYYNVYQGFGDEKSKEIFLAILKCRLFGKYTLDRKYAANDTSYFHNEHFYLDEGENYLDVGAYIGDSIVDFFIALQGKNYEKIYAVEGNLDRCNVIKDKYKKEIQDGKIAVYNCGVGAKRSSLAYDGSAAGIGEEVLEIYTLDELLPEEKVTLIKMDIEGMETEAIEGARNIITKQKPKLAICVYHLTDDLWRIPEMIRQMVPEYKMYLEQPVYTNGMLETVLYAIVEEKKN